MILLDSIWTKICTCYKYTTSCLIALLRLVFLTVDFFISAVQYIIFTRVEIVRINMACLPYRCERNDAMDKVAYIDKLCCENPELAKLVDEEIDDDEDLGSDDNGETL